MSENKRLHYFVLPGDRLTDATGQSRRNVAQAGTLGDGPGSVVDVSLQPGERLLTGGFAGEGAHRLARGIEELFRSDISAVPYATLGRGRTSDGYYALRNVDIDALDARAVDRDDDSGLARFDGVIAKKGTRKTHWRAVETNPQDVDTPFDDTSAETIRLSDAATLTRWYDPVGPAVETATGTAVNQPGETVTFREFDLTDASFYDPATNDRRPTLLYAIPYADESPGDVRVWDTVEVGRPKRLLRTTDDTVGQATVGDAVVGGAVIGDAGVITESQWQRVYDTAHEFTGQAVLETGTLRVRANDRDGTFEAYRAEGEINTYQKIGLGFEASEWELEDLDIRHLGLASLTARCTFYNTFSDFDYPVDCTLDRGYETALITRTDARIDAGDPIPTNLRLLLNDIVRTTDRDVAITADVRSRQEAEY